MQIIDRREWEHHPNKAGKYKRIVANDKNKIRHFNVMIGYEVSMKSNNPQAEADEWIDAGMKGMKSDSKKKNVFSAKVGNNNIEIEEVFDD